MTNDSKGRAARAEQMRKDRDKAERRRRTVISVAIVAVVVLLIAVAGWGIKKATDATQDETEVIEPQNVTESGILYPAKDGVDNSKAPLVQTYEDFQCPYCAQFETSVGPWLQEQSAAGAIRLVFMPYSFLDDNGGSTNDYSKRSTNLAMCATDEGGPEAFWKVHNALYANQPKEGTAGPADAELIELASSVGVDVDEACVTSGRFIPWIQKVQGDAYGDGITSTPTVLVDGKKQTDISQAGLEKAINAAAKN